MQYCINFVETNNENMKIITFTQKSLTKTNVSEKFKKTDAEKAKLKQMKQEFKKK